jgi:hypothetical protein
MNAVKLVNPRLIEIFLLNQEGVLDASAWIENDEIVAQATVFASSRLTEKALIALCKIGLGHEKAPARVTISIAQTRAVVRAA